MHPLHDHLAGQLAQRLRARHVVVWYDPRREYAEFVDELRGGPKPPDSLADIVVAGMRARLAEYDGSYFALRMLVEPIVAADEPEPLVLYLPGEERDRTSSVLMELEKAGSTYEPKLRTQARVLLRQRYTDGVVDDILGPSTISYADLARAADTTASEPPSRLRGFFKGTGGDDDAILSAWMVSDRHDPELEINDATSEVAKLAGSRLGFQVPEGTSLGKLRGLLARYVLGSEFRSDLRCEPPASLDSVPPTKSQEQQEAVRRMAARLREAHGDEYETLADRVETELRLAQADVSAEALGSIDTFRFEERLLLAWCSAQISAGHYAEAAAVVAEREGCFWLERDLSRRAQWEACRLMAEVGSLAQAAAAAVAKPGSDPRAWIDAYTEQNGWHRLDMAQRRLEALVTTLDEEPDESALRVVRRVYEDACQAMAVGFSSALERTAWVVPSVLHQTRIFGEVVAARPKPVAYFMVDALRYEMAVELSERLPRAAEVALRPAVAAMPTITPIGMAALLPGAGTSFTVEERGGKLGARIDDSFLPDLAARRKHAAARVPQLVDLALDDLLASPPSKLRRKLERAEVVVVRSQEIDHAGETGFTFQARRVIDTVIDNLSRAIRRLAACGVEHAVVTADHGHLFASERDESVRIDAPGGQTIELHRRCWIGRGGKTPSACARVPATALGYASDLDFVFPVGSGVFKGGGDLTFHHGATSLQELVIPVLTVRLRTRQEAAPARDEISVTGLPEAVTNRIFSVRMQANAALFSQTVQIRPLLLHGGKQVGAVGMAIDAVHDRATGCVTLQPGQPATIAFMLSDSSVEALRVVVQDAATDAELFRSPTEIPVQLAM